MCQLLGVIQVKKYFTYDKKLGIELPDPHNEWNQYASQDQEEILMYWEKIRGRIPDRIKEIEQIINLKQEQLSDENNFATSCQLNKEISELASIINDLWIWFRN